ncbi:hypothetical protein ACQ4WX_39895 [Streptomyces lasalocidi]
MSTAVESPPAWETDVDDVLVALSARGDLVAVAGAEGTVKIFDAAMGAEIGALDLPGGALKVALSPDAQHMVATGPMGYALWRRVDGRTTVRESGAWSAAAAWADTERVAVASGRRALVLDTDGGELWRTEPAASTVTDVAWMRRGGAWPWQRTGPCAVTNGTPRSRSPPTPTSAPTSRSPSHPPGGGSAAATRTRPSTSGAPATAAN